MSPDGPGAGLVADGYRELAASWRADRPARQQRTGLVDRDFDDLRDAGYHRLAVPEAHGGTWRDVRSSGRAVCDTLRVLAAGDPAVALVASMHPAVLAFWLTPDLHNDALQRQRASIYDGAAAGLQWGTITSEPGSGGDISRTRSAATPAGPAPGDGSSEDRGTGEVLGERYTITGTKHFGSGSGVTSFMVTTAVAAGDDEPSLFALDVRGRPWDGTAGLELVAEWDGMGMAATQSHGMELVDMPAVRHAGDGPLQAVTGAAGPFNACLFIAVVLGVVDEAVATARAQLAKRPALRAYEQVEWTRAESDHWLACQAYEGAVRAAEGGAPGAMLGCLRAKQATAELAESTLGRLSRVLGGGTFSRRSPFSHWYEDVRALGFLRPPWGFAYDAMYALAAADLG
ncbi:MAG: acyl-CoA dehydrogenase family protein [Actinomycetota bacterium]|nr:acyl-CoA dehydrogenase family protein [Actinomycetota bacterium]